LLVIALDPPQNVDPVKWALNIAARTRDLSRGFKVGLPLLIRSGLDGLKLVVGEIGGDVVADLKLADIGDVMALTVRALAEAGVSGVIAHAFVGRRGALDKLSQVCRELGLKLILVVSMSHPGSEEFIDRHLREFVELAQSLEAYGVVAPATRPGVIRAVREIAGDSLKIYAPGVGAQGAEPGSALCAGADFEIVGRAITGAVDPRIAAEEVLKKQGEAVERCRRGI